MLLETVLPETKPPTVPELLDKLEALGGPAQIALHFEAEKILAHPCRANTCAVAVYLQRETGLDVSVGALDCVVWRGSDGDQRYVLPEPIREFILGFDDLEYPDLIDWPRLVV